MYHRFWICFVIGICQGFEYAKDAKGSEYAWVCSWTMPEYVWTCLKHNPKKLYELSSTYRYIGVLESC